MSFKTPAEIQVGTPSDSSVIHASEDAMTNKSRAHTERDISRLQSAALPYSETKASYKVGDMVEEGKFIQICITSIMAPEAFDQNKWEPQETSLNKVQDLVNPNTVTYASTQAIVDALANFPATSLIFWESFAARFVGVFGTPAQNVPPWTEVASVGEIIIVNESVFGVQRDVVKFIDDDGGITSSELALDAQNWQDIFDFGASFGGIFRKDTVDNGRFFAGCGVAAAENPAATGDRRYGVSALKGGDFVELDSPDSAFNVILNGLNGVPKILFDEYFEMEVVILPGFANAEVFVNGILLPQTLEFAVNNNTLNKVTITSGSGGATDRTFYVENYGLTIYQDSNVKVLSSIEAESFNQFIITPSGKRDYSIEFPTGFPKAIGSSISILGNNALGSITLLSPDTQIAFDGLNPKLINVDQAGIFRFINSVTDANKYATEEPQPAKSIQNDGVLETPGSVSYNVADDTFEFKGISTTLQVGHESFVNIVNNTGLELISKQVVKIIGYDATLDFFTVELAQADTLENSIALGMVTENILDGGRGKITVFGKVNDIDTSSFTEGDPVYLDPNTAGDITEVLPSTFITQIGNVGKVDAVTGWIQIDVKVILSQVAASALSRVEQNIHTNINSPSQINFEVTTELHGIEQPTNGTFKILSTGIYDITLISHSKRITGTSIKLLRVFLQKKARGVGDFVSLPDSTDTIWVNQRESRTVMRRRHMLAKDDIIRIGAVTSNSNVNFSPRSAEGDIPMQPSACITIEKIR